MTHFRLFIELKSPRFSEEKNGTYLHLVQALCNAFQIDFFDDEVLEYIDYDIPETQFTPYQHHFKINFEGNLQSMSLISHVINCFEAFHNFETSIRVQSFQVPDRGF